MRTGPELASKDVGTSPELVSKDAGTSPELASKDVGTSPELSTSDIKSLIIKIIRENPKVKRIELADCLNMTLNGVRYHLKKLSDAGIVEFEGNSRWGHWVIHEELVTSVKKT